MAEISYHCDVVNGFNAQSDVQTITGLLTYLKIGDTEYLSDLSVTNPEDIESEIACVGVLSSVFWGGGEADPLQFDMRISTANKNSSIELVQKTLVNTEVDFTFVVFEYDPIAKKYFRCFHNDDEVYNGLVLKEGGDLAIGVDPDAAGEVVAPKNFPFSIGIMPPEPTEGQPIHFAASVDKKMVKQWGVKIG
jgi:hypothetical protein